MGLREERVCRGHFGWVAIAVVTPIALLAGQAAEAGVYTDCQTAIEAGDLAAAGKLAEVILRFNSVTDPADQEAGARCLGFAFGTDYVYSFALGRFVTRSDEESELSRQRAEDAENAASLAAAEAAREAQELLLAQIAAEEERRRTEREQEVWSKVADACFELYRTDPDQTVTNRICLDVFLQTGLPD